MSSLRDIATAALVLPIALIYGLASKKVRPTLAERLGGGDWKKAEQFNKNDIWIWVHGASVGEIAGAEPLLKRIKQQWPNKNILVTTTSATGQKRAESIKEVSLALVIPFDLVVLFQRAIGELNIERLIILETELWPALFSFAQKRKFAVAWVNARISDETIQTYSRFRWYFSKLLNQVEVIFVQSEIDKERFLSLGVDKKRITVNGSTKFDLKYPAREELVSEFNGQYCLDQSKPTLAIGCLRKEEEELVLNALAVVLEKLSLLQVIIAPRHPERYNTVCSELEKRKIKYHRRSLGVNSNGSSVIVVDLMGELAAAYALSNLAVICGTFAGAGGHNPVEAVAVGTPVVVGKSDYNIRVPLEILSSVGAVVRVDSGKELEEKLIELLGDHEKLKSMAIAATSSLDKLSGATQHIVDYLGAGDDK